MKNFFTFNSLGIFSLIILVFLFFQAIKFYSNESKRHQKLWIGTIVSIFITQVLDIMCWSLSGVQGSEIRILSLIINSLCFVSFAIFPYMLALFIEYNSNYSEKSYYLLKRIFLPIVIFNIILAVLSAPLGIYFRLDAGNYYLRGDLNFISILLCALPVIVVIFRIFFNYYKKESPGQMSIFIVGLMFTILFTILQVLNIFPIPVQMPSVTLAILFLYMFLMNDSLYLDYLTGIKNTKGINKFFYDLPVQLDKCLVVIFIDIDGFKKINDDYGHKEGDWALISFAKILSKAVRKDDLVSRAGGDEFLIAAIVNSPDEVDKIMSRINSELAFFNRDPGRKYPLLMSYGISIAYPGMPLDKDAMMADADQKMYRQKSIKNSIQNFQKKKGPIQNAD